MSEDKALLEAAARAAGYQVARVSDDGVSLMLVGVQEPWNPHADDGDSRRLEVRLRIAIRLDDPAAVSAGFSKHQSGAPTHDGQGPWYWKEWLINHNGDGQSATRLAVLRVAAQIGRDI